MIQNELPKQETSTCYFTFVTEIIVGTGNLNLFVFINI